MSRMSQDELGHWTAQPGLAKDKDGNVLWWWVVDHLGMAIFASPKAREARRVAAGLNDGFLSESQVRRMP